MNHELAKQLKEAGFPIGDNEECEVGNCWKNQHEHCYPSLSELIEACGEKQFVLESRRNQFGKFWYTSSGISENVEADGKTPEEAVARLWLELNK